MKNKLTRIGLVILTILLFIGLGRVLVPKKSSDKGASIKFSGDGFISEENDTFDLMFFGDSNVPAGYVPDIMYNNCGITSYASGAPTQSIQTIEALINEGIKTQHPKMIVLDANVVFRRKGNVMGFWNYLIDPVLYHSRWKDISANDLAIFKKKKRASSETRGYIFNKEIYKRKNIDYMDNPNSKAKKIPLRNKHTFLNILNTCKKNDIKLVLLNIPSPTDWDYHKHNAIKKLIKNTDINFYDLNLVKEDRYKVDMENDLGDKSGQHLNIYGAIKITNYIEKIIKEDYYSTYTKMSNKDVKSFNNSKQKFLKMLMKNDIDLK